MLDFGYYNMDCMEGMKEFPDKYFDLAIVDPPYGDAEGGGVWNRFGERFEGYINPQARKRGSVESAERAENGQRSSEKNCFVGRCAEAGVFRRTVSRLTESDHMGGKLLRTPGNPLFSDMAQNERAREVYDGDVRVCLDII